MCIRDRVEAYWEIDILKDIYFIPKKVNKRKSYELIRDEEFLRQMCIRDRDYIHQVYDSMKNHTNFKKKC